MSSTINIIPLSREHMNAPLISHTLESLLLHHPQKTMIVYSRRGNARAWICGDCGFYQICPNCDLALAYHTHPTKTLICHQCGYKEPCPIVCPSCTGSAIHPVGIGIQQIEASLQKLFPNKKILRIDSDTHESAEVLYEKINLHDIIISTHATIIHKDITLCVWPLFELNLSIPSHKIEEEIMSDIIYCKKQQKDIIIQTYLEKHPLIDEILSGNTRSLLARVGKERKDFGYPPFAELATIRIHDKNKEKVQSIMLRLIHKIGILKKPSTFFSFDTDIYEKQHGEWQQKILLKDTHLMYLLEELEIEIVRNRNITLEWK